MRVLLDQGLPNSNHCAFGDDPPNSSGMQTDHHCTHSTFPKPHEFQQMLRSEQAVYNPRMLVLGLQVHRGRQQHAGVSAVHDTRTAEIEAELAAVRAALQEAEAQQVEAQMAVLTLQADNSILHAQLQGLRQQKQQLEMVLLAGELSLQGKVYITGT